MRSEYLTSRQGQSYVDYGEGLVAAKVRDCEWCARCTGTASNLLNNKEIQGRPPWDYLNEIDNEVHIRRYPYAP